MNSACPSSTYWLFEWCMATMMVLIALTLAMPGDTMERSALKPIAHMGFSEPNMALIFVGDCTVMLIGWMVTRTRGDRDHLPPPAPIRIADVPPPFLQGPREAVDLMRELRDLARRQVEDISRIAECIRIVRDETRRQTEILGLIEREQAIENRSHGGTGRDAVLHRHHPGRHARERETGQGRPRLPVHWSEHAHQPGGQRAGRATACAVRDHHRADHHVRAGDAGGGGAGAVRGARAAVASCLGPPLQRLKRSVRTFSPARLSRGGVFRARELRPRRWCGRRA